MSVTATAMAANLHTSYQLPLGKDRETRQAFALPKAKKRKGSFGKAGGGWMVDEKLLPCDPVNECCRIMEYDSILKGERLKEHQKSPRRK